MSKKFKKSLKQTAYIVCIMIALLFIISIVTNQFNKIDYEVDYDNVNIPKQVLDYENTIKTYATQYDVTKHIALIMAIMMQESGGRGNDPMQASESYCGSRNCIQNPETSIKQGIRYFSDNLEAAGGNVDLAIQSYNYGKGFIKYVNDRDASYSVDVAIAFSQQKYKEVKDKQKYRCVREDSRKLNACYGDIYYVEAVRNYERALIDKE